MVLVDVPCHYQTCIIILLDTRYYVYIYIYISMFGKPVRPAVLVSCRTHTYRFFASFRREWKLQIKLPASKLKTQYMQGLEPDPAHPIWTGLFQTLLVLFGLIWETRPCSDQYELDFSFGSNWFGKHWYIDIYIHTPVSIGIVNTIVSVSTSFFSLI